MTLRYALLTLAAVAVGMIVSLSTIAHYMEL
jgi:hypothetical protein